MFDDGCSHDDYLLWLLENGALSLGTRKRLMSNAA